MNDNEFKTPCATLNTLRDISHEDAKKNGWWDEPRNDGELIALMHSELSEALEALRKDDAQNLAEEMADTIIRILDYCGARDIDIGLAVWRKTLTNRTRGHKHGGKKF